jgi:hypothetical protein
LFFFVFLLFVFLHFLLCLAAPLAAAACALRFVLATAIAVVGASVVRTATTTTRAFLAGIIENLLGRGGSSSMVVGRCADAWP